MRTQALPGPHPWIRGAWTVRGGTVAEDQRLPMYAGSRAAVGEARRRNRARLAEMRESCEPPAEERQPIDKLADRAREKLDPWEAAGCG